MQETERLNETHMTENLFSHPVEAEHVATTTTESSDPVENPVFSDRDR